MKKKKSNGKSNTNKNQNQSTTAAEEVRSMQTSGAGGNRSGKTGFKPRQPRKDSNSRRINYDNARVDRVARDIERGSKAGDRNDITDFNRNPEILNAAGSIPFGTILGDYLPGTGITVPGVMTFAYNPAFGTDKYPIAWNKSFQQIYSYVVHANSRNYSYDFTDQALYIMAGQEIFAAIAELVRVYGIMKSYTEPNFYLIEGLLQAMGWDAADLRRNIGNMWYQINDFILQTKDIWIPNVMPLLMRSIRLNSFVYTDAAGERSQEYVFIRDHYYELTQTGSKNGTSLVPALYNAGSQASPNWRIFQRTTNGDSGSQTDWETTSNSLSSYTYAEFTTMLQRMINKLMASKDRGTIFADIMNAYGTDKLFAMGPISSDYTVKPTYNAEILMNIENLTTCPDIWPRTFTQDLGEYGQSSAEAGPLLTQYWKSHYYSEKGAPVGATDNQVLNVHFTGQPSPGAIAEMTRWKVGGNTIDIAYKDGTTWNASTGAWTVKATLPSESDDFLWLPSTCGSEIVRSIFITVRGASTFTSATQNFITRRVPQYTSDSANFPPSALGSPDQLKLWLHFMAFDWHPFLYTYVTKTSLTQFQIYDEFTYAYGDYDNYTFLNVNDLKKLNNAVMYSLLGIPQSGYNHKYLEK